MTGPLADVFLAAHACSEAAIRLIKPGKTNWEVTEAISKIANDYGCKPVEGKITKEFF